MVFLPLHLVHRFGFSTVIRGSESKKVVTLGSLDPRRVLWRLRPFVATWELPILLWVVPQDCCKGLDFRPKGKSIVEGEPSFCARFIGE